MNKSIWIDGLDFSNTKELKENIDVDILIIGGGITGLSTAYHLKDKNVKVALVEANLIGRGVTSKTTGKLTYLQEDIYSKIKDTSSEHNSKLYYESQKEAIKIVKEIIRKEKIDCDFTKTDSITFTNDLSSKYRLEKEKKLLQNFKEKVEDVYKLPTGEKCEYGIKVDNTYVFHPLKYLKSLKEIVEKSNIEVYENTRIESIEKEEDYYICKSKKVQIKAKKVVLALHYPYFLFPFLMPFKVTLEKSYISATPIKKTYSFNAISIDDPVTSIRYHKSKREKYEIFLHGSHNICSKLDEEENFKKLIHKKENASYLWSNIDIITSDHLPYIGKINNNLYIATGYNTWGMTNGSLAGKILSEQLLGNKTKYDEVFSPKRKINKGKIMRFPIVLGSNMKAIFENAIVKNKSWYKNKIRFKKLNGQNVAIYIDEKGIEHIVKRKCPHLKCNLIFNMKEKTWDCPCHGSRFTIDGKCIEGPSNYDISFTDKK